MIADPRAALARLASAGFEPTRTVLCERPPQWATDGRGQDPGTVESMEILTNEVRLTASAPGSSVLVLSDSDYPGWKAWVDGRAVEVLRVNHAFRGVALEPGRHQVRFRFDPWRFRAGAWISAAAVLALLALAVAQSSRVPRR